MGTWTDQDGSTYSAPRPMYNRHHRYFLSLSLVYLLSFQRFRLCKHGKRALKFHIAVQKGREACNASLCGQMPDGVLSSTVLPIITVMYLHACLGLVCRSQAVVITPRRWQYTRGGSSEDTSAELRYSSTAGWSRAAAQLLCRRLLRGGELGVLGFKRLPGSCHRPGCKKKWWWCW